MPSYYRDPHAPTPNVPRRVGVTALIERRGEILVERRRDDADVWAFIGGTVEEDERVLDALSREVREETGYEVESVRLLGVFSDPTRVVAYADGTVCRIVSIAFRVEVAGDDEPRLSVESAGMRFASPTHLGQLSFWPAHVPIRDAFLAHPASPVVA